MVEPGLQRLDQLGVRALSDAELLALIFGSGTVTKAGPVSALGLGQALLRAYDSLFRLAQRDLKELTRVTGIGPAKAVQLVAAFEKMAAASDELNSILEALKKLLRERAAAAEKEEEGFGIFADATPALSGMKVEERVGEWMEGVYEGEEGK